MAAGDFGHACAQFAESERLDPAAGTLLNLADCYEKTGQLASAWMAFREATTAAERAGRASWASQATARARLLEPRLPTVTLAVGVAATPGLEILRDGTAVPRSVWGSPIPVDPSTSRLEARAPNKKTWSTTFTVSAEHPHVDVAVPALEDEPAPASEGAASKPVPDAVTHSPRSLAGPLALGAAGGAGLLVGSYLGVRTFQLRDQSSSECAHGCTNAARQDRSQAQTWADASTVWFVGAGVALAGAAVWWWLGRSPTEHKSAVRVLPLVGPNVNGLILRGDL
jgi:hypothetical protein